MLRILSAGGGRLRTIGSAKVLPTFEATPVDFFWPDRERSERICDRGPTFRNPFSSANWGRRWGGPWSRRSPAIIHAKAHELPAEAGALLRAAYSGGLPRKDKRNVSRQPWPKSTVFFVKRKRSRCGRS